MNKISKGLILKTKVDAFREKCLSFADLNSTAENLYWCEEEFNFNLDNKNLTYKFVNEILGDQDSPKIVAFASEIEKIIRNYNKNIKT